MPVAPFILGVRRPVVAGLAGSYLGVSGDSAIGTDASTLHAYLYEAGVYQSALGTVALPSVSSGGGFGMVFVARSINRIHSDAAALVPDGSLAFIYKTGSTTWRIAVWDVEDTNALLTFTWSSTVGLSAPVYADGWLWYFRVTTTALQLRKIRCDLTGDTLVRSETISNSDRYGDDGNVAYMLLTDDEAASGFDGAPLDSPAFLRDGSAANMTPGRGFAGQTCGQPAADGRSVGTRGGSSPLTNRMASLSAGGAIESLIPNTPPDGWGLVDAQGGSVGSDIVGALNPAGTAVAIYPVYVPGETQGSTQPRQLVRLDLATTYANEDPIPYASVELAPGGLIPFAMLARS